MINIINKIKTHKKCIYNKLINFSNLFSLYILIVNLKKKIDIYIYGLKLNFRMKKVYKLDFNIYIF